MALDTAFDGVSAVSAAWHHQSSRAPWHNQRPLGSATPLGVSLGAAATAGQEGVFQPRTAKDCKQKFFAQTLDHFRHVPGADDKIFQQRYFLCDDYWRPAHGDRTENGARGGERAPPNAMGPIFFYAGNEADVSLYLSSNGLMWENAKSFNALLVFAEHRFYGESLPFGTPDKGREYLSTSQALADYAFLVWNLRKELGAEGSPVIAFGGSYGGMLASWLRLKYPHIIDGAIAASAPVLAFEGEIRPTPDPESFAETVTRAAGRTGGAAEACADNVRRAFSAVFSMGGEGDEETAASPEDVVRLLRVCPGQEPQGQGTVAELAWWARSAFDYLAMGNYPYATGYILNDGDGGVTLPPWPLRVACSFMADPELQTGGQEVLVNALAEAIGVYYNATGDVECFSPAAGANNESSVDADNWNWQSCTEMSMPMSTDGIRDMFWRAPWDPAARDEQCLEEFGVSPQEGWAAAEYGGYGSWSQVTNVVFSNGKLDPWSGMGVLDPDQVGPGIHIIVMDQAAHHLDLFFENPSDPDDVLQARRIEMNLVEDWVRDGYQKVVRKRIAEVSQPRVPPRRPKNVW